ncbi:F0F1 ATP synthase subunit delta [Tessaracoccus sp. OS52]|uniref:F0F1 ATP synthase subunit delta n=1 Tax=Tessaracoccus sp. OS52 TaxID=2886691 RepID=UPI001D10862E|nr:F0F1 ATP synthase subunit delta [Tessaracoccus sp. OS52]MCC2593057.1 F0F1 ATP synthase subunit delta [Tessaracoccus sp. OS52]
MSKRDAAISSLDAKADAIALDAAAASELFGVVDLLDGQPPLRRSLSDPSAAPEARVQLAEKLFAGRLSAPALSVLSAVVGSSGLSARRLVGAVERQGVRGLLREALRSGELARVQAELHSFATTVREDAALADALRNRSIPIAARRELIDRLAAAKVHPITAELLSRAAAARVRNLPVTVSTYLDMAAVLGNQQIAKVTVARPMDEQRLERLRKALVNQEGGEIVLQVEVDPEVLGGMRVQVGDHIIESTVAGRLEDARRLLNTQ